MEAIIFMGIQASGKSSFYKEQFFNTHFRLSMDLFNTRNKETQFFKLALSLHQRLVIDNTNPSKKDRLRYIPALKERKYKIIGYYFQSKLQVALERNEQRTEKAKIPEVGIRAVYSQLEMPEMNEGFDELYYVSIDKGTFIVQNWKNEI